MGKPRRGERHSKIGIRHEEQCVFRAEVVCEAPDSLPTSLGRAERDHQIKRAGVGGCAQGRLIWTRRGPGGRSDAGIRCRPANGGDVR